jgi:hypothetical protein
MKTKAPTMDRGDKHVGEEAQKQQGTHRNRELQSSMPHVSVDARSWKMGDTVNKPMMTAKYGPSDGMYEGIQATISQKNARK